MSNKNIPTEKEQLSAKLEFTARITLPDGTVIEKVIEADGGIPSAEEMDFHTLNGFRQSFDKYERRESSDRRKRQGLQGTYGRIRKGTVKKDEKPKDIGRRHKVESELCNTTATLYSSAAKSLKPKENVKSFSMEEICLDLAQCKSYRVASDIANRLLRRHGADEIKPTTLEYRIVHKRVRPLCAIFAI